MSVWFVLVGCLIGRLCLSLFGCLFVVWLFDWLFVVTWVVWLVVCCYVGRLVDCWFVLLVGCLVAD